MTAWLRFFRIVNLPTVPGDVLAGVAAALVGAAGAAPSAASVVCTCLASCAVYLYGMADNDIVGAAGDGPERPIPAGELSLGAARVARALCLLAAVGFGFLADAHACGAQQGRWLATLLLLLAVVGYNRTKNAALMGLCRALDVLCGAALCCSTDLVLAPLAVALVWFAYVTVLTRLSRGEEADPAKRAFVGFLIGALVYLQLAALLAFYLVRPASATRGLLVAGAVMLVLLRLAKRVFPKVSAS